MKDLHIHTKRTDGEGDPADILRLAESLNVETVAFTEHISKTPTYDWFLFRDEIKRLNPHDVKVLVGVEAKVLDESGELNVSREILEAADIVLGSCHGLGKVEWLLKSECDVIAHPQIDENNIGKFVNCDKILEINSKHRLPTAILDNLIVDTNNVFSFGSDTHKLANFASAQEYFKDIVNRYPKIHLTTAF
jgi:histidinol phosphatase-like PHP family hydrolase